MKVIFVDDEQAAITKFESICSGLDLDYTSFSNPQNAVEYAKQNRIDVAFLDVEMPEMNGLELAKILKKINPNTKIIFLTAYDHYALSAFGVDAIGYLLKPYTKQDIIKELEKAKRILDIPSKAVYIETMPMFNVYVDGKLLSFKSNKAKELLALIIDRNGETVNNDYAITYLWENKAYTENTKSLYRMIKKNLKDYLDSVEIGFIIIDERKTLSANKDSFTCDYYDLLNGSKKAGLKFNGEYMFEYPWAEKTTLNIQKMLAREDD